MTAAEKYSHITVSDIISVSGACLDRLVKHSSCRCTLSLMSYRQYYLSVFPYFLLNSVVYCWHKMQ